MTRSLGFANRGGYERLWLGQAIHGRYQEQALEKDPTYRREVVVRHTFEHRGWTVTVHGRIDGLRREPDGALVVEEIKSVRRGGALPPPVREMYQRQAILYAWMLGRAEKAPVRAELVLIAIGSDDVEREELAIDLHLLEVSVHRRLNGLLHAWESERQRRRERQEAAERLVFPYGEVRPGQDLILAAVETAVANREHLLLQATTGIGKTVAALYPALKYALAHDKRLFVLTAKTTQQEMATAVLDLLNQQGAFRSLRLRAKSKMCANDQILCHEEYCRYAKDYGLKLVTSGILPRLWESFRSIAPDDVFAAAKASEVCPFEVEPGAFQPGPGHDLRLQLRLRPLRLAHCLRAGPGPVGHHPHRRRGAQPGGPRARLLQPGAFGGRRPPGRRGGAPRRRPDLLPHPGPLPHPGAAHRKRRRGRHGGGPRQRPGRRVSDPGRPLLAPPPRARRRVRRLPGIPA